MAFTSNSASTIQPIAQALKGINFNIELAKTGENAIDKIKIRLDAGLGENNKILDTKSKARYGKYSEEHGKYRQGLGLRYQTRDLNVTGDMVADFSNVSIFNNNATIGFHSEYEANKARKNELYMGIDVFVPSDEMIEFGLELLKEKINGIIGSN